MLEELRIENMIYEIRGKHVMLDSDLAILYNVETKRINEAVKRNKEKFPERFCFILNDYEYKNLKSQNATSSLETNYGGRRYNPYVFTEQGVAMLATVLKSKIATQVSIRIMDAFVNMRHFINDNMEIFKDLEEIKTLTIQNTNDIRILEESFDKFKTKEKINHIFYDGQIYDAYSLLVDILKQAKNEIVIIDNYIDKTILDIITSMNIDVTIYQINIIK